ncbi:hypothetical protein DPMN_012474 [Dreissena polymorpha]|uniref:Uncharacterized protein n=1 Tax=Dreissena polymorpha TaxID=45954 RepID=A0A9D4N734_DREPO|nr:hypothetical protein DPMN_012474 [Dreissena polymorpha]
MKVFIETPTIWFEAFKIVTTMTGAAVDKKNGTETNAKHTETFTAACRVLRKASFVLFKSVGATRIGLKIFGMMFREQTHVIAFDIRVIFRCTTLTIVCN